MTHEARTAELKAMTAKALRPIAKDLGITGASRMTKDALIDEIVAAEALADDLANEAALAEAAGLNVTEVGVAHLADEIERDHAAALTVNAKLTQIARLEAHPSQEARATAYEIRDELLADGFTEQAVANVPALKKPSTQADEIERQKPLTEDVTGVAAIVAAPKIDKYDRRWAMSFPLAPGGDGYVMQGHADYCATWGHATQTDVSRDGTRTVAGYCPRCGDPLAAEEMRDRMIAEADAQLPAPGSVLEADPQPREVFVRTMASERQETVVVEETRNGIVRYRFAQKNGPLSAPYSLRADRFIQRYTKVSK